MSHSALHETAREHLLLHFTNHAAAYGGERDLLVLERGEGPYVFDTAGNRYVDALSSLFCSQLGYSFGEEIAAAASAQMQKLAFNTNWATAHPPAIELAEKLADADARATSTTSSSPTAAPSRSRRCGRSRASTSPPRASRSG